MTPRPSSIAFVHVAAQAAVIGAQVLVVHVDQPVLVLLEHLDRVAATLQSWAISGAQVEVLRVGLLHQGIDLTRILDEAADVGMNVSLDFVFLERDLADGVHDPGGLADGGGFVLHVGRRRAEGEPLALEALEIAQKTVAFLEQTLLLVPAGGICRPSKWWKRGGLCLGSSSASSFMFWSLTCRLAVVNGSTPSNPAAWTLGADLRPVYGAGRLSRPGYRAETPVDIALGRAQRRAGGQRRPSGG